MGQISEFYKGKNILVTGATGFCGKVLVEKLLRSCNVGKIFILVRHKKKASPQQRFNDYVKHRIFDGLRSTDPLFSQRIHLISGDITIDDLAMSETDMNILIKELHIIFHCAANVRFDDPIREAININVVGTWRMLQLAEKCEHLEVFSYMSTAFSQACYTELKEEYYPTKIDVFEIIKLTKELEPEYLELIEQRLLDLTKHPNTYTLSKGFAENVVYTYREKFPVVVIRPSLVWFALREPLPGYLEGMNSGVSIICGGMTGFIRTMYTTNDAGAKITPADYLASATIASAWKKSQTKNDDVLFYNCTSTNENTFLWRESFEKNKHLFMEYAPYKKIIWYPNLTFTSSYIWNMTCLILFQLFPAMFLDLFRMLSGKKPIFTSLQMKVIKGIKIFYYFTTRNFLFETDKLHNLFNSLDKDDKIKFYFDHTTIYWPDYFENGGRNLRKYILKESELNIPKAQQKLRKLYYADRSLKIFGVLLLSYYLWQLTQWVLT